MKEQKRTLITIILLCLTLFIFSFFWTLSKESASIVFIGLLPFLLHASFVIARVYLKLNELADVMFMWVTPFLFPLLFFIVWASNGVPLISAMDGQALATWQAVASLTLSIITFVLVSISLSSTSHRKPASHPKPVPPPPQQPEQSNQLNAMNAQLQQTHQHITHLQEQLQESQKYQHMVSEYMQHNAAYADRVKELEDELRVTKQRLSISRDSISVTLREIEAKAKALNFVVGRVYADKKGGSKEIREELHIPRELYNEFSEITSDYTSDDASRLLKILLILQNKLALYEMPESKIFTLDSNPQIPLDRSPSGSDPIIEVLSKNDQDPVVDYYSGAKEVCSKLISFLEREQTR